MPLRRTLLSCTLLLGASRMVAAQGTAPEHRPLDVVTPDGLHIAAQVWGKPDGPENLFIHGFGQSHLTWGRQARSGLPREFKLVTYDLRGHGSSDKPLDRDRYQDSRPWADEMKAVMDAAGLGHPVVVAWSYGARIVADYLKIHGPGRLAGINFVDAGTSSRPEYFGADVPGLLRGMNSEDLATNIAATIRFLHTCFETQPGDSDFQEMLAFNMVVPPRVRANMGGRTLEITDLLASLRMPVLVTHGEADRVDLPSMGRYTAATVPGAALSLYPGVGHASFYEAAERFNDELAAFVRRAQGR